MEIKECSVHKNKLHFAYNQTLGGNTTRGRSNRCFYVLFKTRAAVFYQSVLKQVLRVF